MTARASSQTATWMAPLIASGGYPTRRLLQAVCAQEVVGDLRRLARVESAALAFISPHDRVVSFALTASIVAASRGPWACSASRLMIGATCCVANTPRDRVRSDVAPARELAVGGEHERDIDLALVQRRVLRARWRQRDGRSAAQAVAPAGPRSPSKRLRTRAAPPISPAPGRRSRWAMVRTSWRRANARRDGERVLVGERRRRQQREAAALLEGLGEPVGGGGVRRALGRWSAISDSSTPMYSGYMSSPPSRSAWLVISVRADRRLELDREALGLQRLLVELAEDVLLGEVLRPDADRRRVGLRVAGASSSSPPPHAASTQRGDHASDGERARPLRARRRPAGCRGRARRRRGRAAAA